MNKYLVIGIAILVILLAVAAVFLAQQPAQPTPLPPPPRPPLPSPLPPATTTTPQATPLTITIGVTDKVTDLDPANAYDFFTWEVLNNIMSGMTRYVPGTTELELGIAASYSTA